ncbi:3-deoxy-D-manno-octulosonate 8-phosphate phosphatase (KDO 8-P phosphatase) [Pseudobutyrivibrio sp. OR37]|uniref:KdsC family phosphatase n=1 Tax=Pseudobutyrivibrio sp. OR37 TaxID=1798186 RepID=UPI0008E40D1A|nr:HAD hydrolase family protein [Pseudobutyrivibrio sp. OR37]SFH86157.1 3-deoxy-D-manno-octulosonate 8-phosphate phosphatase (KDO 8-P phosphatase) [Pseudobutyrivibrio sp. OR37]
MKNIKYLVLDVDGTLTDGHIYMGQEGEIMKAFSAKDGYGICHIGMPNGIIPVIITGRTSRIVENRAKELGITEIYQGVGDKFAKLTEILEKSGVELNQCAYCGDDMNDYDCMKRIQEAGGLVGCPADACDEVIELADFVSKKDGGRGAVREFIEWMVK